MLQSKKERKRSVSESVDRLMQHIGRLGCAYRLITYSAARLLPTMYGRHILGCQNWGLPIYLPTMPKIWGSLSPPIHLSTVHIHIYIIHNLSMYPSIYYTYTHMSIYIHPDCLTLLIVIIIIILAFWLLLLLMM